MISQFWEASPAKTALSEYFQSQGSMQAAAAQAGFETDINSKYVNSVTYTRQDSRNAIVRVTIKALGGSTAANQQVQLLGTGNVANVDWDCQPSTGGSAVPNKYLPADCRQ